MKKLTDEKFETVKAKYQPLLNELNVAISPSSTTSMIEIHTQVSRIHVRPPEEKFGGKVYATEISTSSGRVTDLEDYEEWLKILSVVGDLAEELNDICQVV